MFACLLVNLLHHVSSALYNVMLDTITITAADTDTIAARSSSAIYPANITAFRRAQ